MARQGGSGVQLENLNLQRKATRRATLSERRRSRRSSNRDSQARDSWLSQETTPDTHQSASNETSPVGSP